MSWNLKRGVLLVIILVVIAVSASPALHYTSVELGRSTGTDVVGDSDGGVLNLNTSTTVYYGEFSQSLVSITNPTTETQEVTVTLDASGTGWTLSSGTRSRTVVLAPNESETFTVNIDDADSEPVDTGYSIESKFSGVSQFSTHRPTSITHNWNWVVASDGTGDFVTIQGAVDAASSGDKVLVESGTYVETVSINKPLFLSGTQSDSPVLQGSFTLGSSDTTIRTMEIDAAGQTYGVEANSVTGAGLRVLNATVYGATDSCLRFVDSDVVEVADNTVTNCGGAAMYGSGAYVGTVEYNDFTNSNTGIRWEAAGGGKKTASSRVIDFASHNKITGNGENVYLETWNNTVFQYNRLEGSVDGVALRLRGKGWEDETVRFTSNYWGASSGPSGGVVDPSTGTVANGGGDSIVIEKKGAVRFDPWLSVAPSDAGDVR